MPSIVHIAPFYPVAGERPYPPTGCQFGDKFFICRADQRPIYLMASLVDSTIKSYNCGIKAPTFYPTVEASDVPATNITYDTVTATNNILYIGYCYYSSVRGVYSQVSPLTIFDMNTEFGSPGAVMKLAISGFYAPRDDAASQDIDTLLVGVQYGVANGVMCLKPDLSFLVGGPTPWDFATTEIIFDLSVAQLNNAGFDLLALSDFVDIPPASKYVERLGERVFYAGQRQTATLANCGLQVVKALLTGTVALTNGDDEVSGTDTAFTDELQVGDVVDIQGVPYVVDEITDDDTMTLSINYDGTSISDLQITRLFRGEGWPRLELTAGSETTFQGFDDSLYHMSLFANGQFLGTVVDVVSPYIAYIGPNDVAASVANTTNFYFAGNNDRIIPSCYTNETPAQFPTPIPECAQLGDARPMTQAVDQGQILNGLAADGEFLYTLFNDTVVQMLGGGELGHNFDPTFRPLTGRVGTIAPGSICKDSVGRIAWIGEEGICLGDSGGVDSIMHQIGCNLLFGKSPQWIDKTTLSSIQMTYSRQYDGLVWGGFSINPQTLTGVLGCTFNSPTILGDNTLFTEELHEGDILGIDNLPYQVLTITNDTHMTLGGLFIGSTGGHLGTLGTGWWALMSLKPQLGIWLFNGLAATSNFLEYQDTNGQGIVLAGGNDNGRLWRVLTPDVYTDLTLRGDDDLPYKCAWREGWMSSATGQISTLDVLRVNGLILNGDTVDLTLNHWHSNFPVRTEEQVSPTQRLTADVDEEQIAFDIPLETVAATRYHSMEVEYDSQYYDGAVAHDGPLEITRLTSVLGTAGP